MATAARLDKSTNVRSRKEAVPVWLKTGVHVLQALSPQATARAAAPLFFRTQRSRANGDPAVSTGRRLEIPFGGERIAAWSWGSGPAVLLVHGWNGRASQLGAFVEPLVASGMRAVAFDHVGHGESTGGSASMAEMAEAIAAVSRAVGETRAVIAHSLGAAATVLALHDGLAIDRAVLIAPPITPEPWFRRFRTLLGLDDETGALTRAHIERRVGRTFEELHGPTLAKHLRQRALIVHDRDDREVPIEAGEALSYAWEGSRFLVTAGLGHNRILRSEGVIESARRFVTAAP
jgi:predicted alpha/beta hydrolase family esterase